jgi:hypothetical protein
MERLRKIQFIQLVIISFIMCLFIGCDTIPLPPVLSNSPNVSNSNPFKPDTVWIGKYECSGLVIDLKLEIIEVNNNTVKAIFDFNHIKSGNSGSFYLIGRYNSINRKMVFEPREWIKRPSNWVTVGMDGWVLENPLRYEGKITYSSCKSFSVTLDSSVNKTSDLLNQNKSYDIVVFEKGFSSEQKTAVLEIANAIRSGKVEVVRKYAKRGVNPTSIINFWSSEDQLSNLKFIARKSEWKGEKYIVLFEAERGMSSCQLKYEGKRLVIGECTFNDGN